ncbi:MAG: phosphatase PAP2 family protein [Anaerolineales bacterium]|nr:phosphatase PAP2 family protein [Anaerolineales bacterium]
MIQGIEWGTGIILWLQQLGDWLQIPMESISFLGTEYAYLFLLPALFWCVDAGLGMRVGISVMAATGIYSSIKMVFRTPRPFWINPDIRPLAVETSFGAPSGHSMSAVGLWGRLAAAIKTRWLQVLLILLITLIAISRLYLGVHYPIDVLSGLLGGVILVWLLVRFEQPVLRWFLSLGIKSQIAVLLAVALILIGSGYAALHLQSSPVPDAWLARIEELEPGKSGHPYDMSGLISSTGTLFGVMLGGLFLFRGGGLSRSASLKQALLRYSTGIIILVVLYFGLRQLHIDNSLIANIYRFLRYSIMGMWVSYGAPRMFSWLKL